MDQIIISDELFKEYSPLQPDTFTDGFAKGLRLAQRMYIEKLIGAALLAEIQLQVQAAVANPEAVPYPITPLNQALIIQIAPVLATYAVYLDIPFHYAAIVNKGVTVRSSENSAAVTMKDVAMLKRWLLDQAQTWEALLQDYLCGCANSYPLFPYAGRCGGGCGQPKNSPYSSGMYIPKRRRKC